MQIPEFKAAEKYLTFFLLYIAGYQGAFLALNNPEKMFQPLGLSILLIVAAFLSSWAKDRRIFLMSFVLASYFAIQFLAAGILTILIWLAILTF